jgi:hypothetical protein
VSVCKETREEKGDMIENADDDHASGEGATDEYCEEGRLRL